MPALNAGGTPPTAVHQSISLWILIISHLKSGFFAMVDLNFSIFKLSIPFCHQSLGNPCPFHQVQVEIGAR